MVDKKILREKSQDVLVIPFTEEMADKLDKFCRIQIENIEQNKVEKLIMSFLTRKNDKELEMAFNKYATESEQTNNILPVAILPVLAEYIVLLVIDGCEETKRRALYTLMLKNALLIAVKGDGFVAHPKAVADIFGNYYDYLRDEKVFGKGEENNNVLAEVLDAAEESFTEKIGEVDSETIKAIVYDAVLYRYANFIKDIKREITNIQFLVANLLKLSKLDANSVQFINKEVKVEEIIQNVVKNVSSICDLKNIKINILMYYYLIIKVGNEDGKTLEELHDKIKEDLTKALYSANYSLERYYFEERAKHNIVFYDHYLERLYQFAYETCYQTLKVTDFAEYKLNKKKSKTVVAKIDELSITADDLFASLETKYSSIYATSSINRYQILKDNVLYNPWTNKINKKYVNKAVKADVYSVKIYFALD